MQLQRNDDADAAIRYTYISMHFFNMKTEVGYGMIMLAHKKGIKLASKQHAKFLT